MFAAITSSVHSGFPVLSSALLKPHKHGPTEPCSEGHLRFQLLVQVLQLTPEVGLFARATKPETTKRSNNEDRSPEPCDIGRSIPCIAALDEAQARIRPNKLVKSDLAEAHAEIVRLPHRAGPGSTCNPQGVHILRVLQDSTRRPACSLLLQPPSPNHENGSLPMHCEQ